MEHLHHMRLVFQILASNKQFLKKSKCCLVKFQIACLGYIITQDGVHADESKILGVLEWPCPTTVHIRGLRGSLVFLTIVVSLFKTIVLLQHYSLTCCARTPSNG